MRFSCLKRPVVLLLCVFVFPSCVSAPVMLQPQVNSLVTARKFEYALKVLEKNEENYGPNNRLLYLLDYGLVLHLTGRYEESIPVFEEAKKIYDQLLTVSLSKEGMTWLINDYFAPYRGEDFERVMINIVQALNFAAQGNIEEALVDARDVDSKLSVINQQYKADQQNVYKEDAFARFLMGLLYEAGGTNANINDAYISYVKALNSYENLYQKSYGTKPPDILIENLLATAKVINAQEFEEYKARFSQVKFLDLNEKSKKGEIVVVQYHGLSPIKHQFELPVPLPNGIIAKLAFPRYDKRSYESKIGTLQAVGANQQIFTSGSELGEDISAIAIQNLNNRRVRVIAKAAIRSAGKVILEESAESSVRDQYGRETSQWFSYLSSLYNIASEQADLRSWQTLPGEIRVARLILEPGEYKVFFEGQNLGTVLLVSGNKKFFVVRTND